MDPLFIGAITLASLGFVLLVHHGCVHANDPADSHAKVESCAPVCFFQPRDISHFEACILVCLTCGLTLAVCSFFIAAGILFVAGLLIACVYVVCAYDGSLMRNVSNHETWILVLWSNAVLLAVVGGTR